MLSTRFLLMGISSPLLRTVSRRLLPHSKFRDLQIFIVHPNISSRRTDAPYNLARLSSASTLAVRDVKLLNYTYEYDAPSPGEGVDIYVVDTGQFFETGDTAFQV